MPHVIFPAGPDDAEDLARVHITAWRETYQGLLPDSYLARMSVPVYARRFRAGLLRPAERRRRWSPPTGRGWSATPPAGPRGRSGREKPR